MLGDREAAFRKNLDQWTTWTLTAIAFTNRVGQDMFHRLEVGNLRANACDVRGSDAPRLRPHVLTITKSDSQQRANLIQREEDQKASLITFPKPKQASAKRNWSAFNAAQTNETYEFQGLLYDLCQTIEEAERHKAGRLPIPAADAAFAVIYKVYSAKSGRRVISQLHEAYERGYLERPIHFNRISASLEKESLSPILRELIVKSNRPLTAVEDVFALDSTGFTGSRFTRWGDVKYRGRKEKRWAKLHLACGVKTHIVTDAIIDGPNASDSRQLPHLLRTTDEHFTIRRVVADKGYSVVKAHEAIAKVGAEAYIPFKKDATGGQTQSRQCVGEKHFSTICCIGKSSSPITMCARMSRLRS